MSRSHDENHSGRPALANRIEMICDEFEKSCKSENRPELERYLQRMPKKEQLPLLEELLSIELEFHRKAGRDVDVNEYLAQFPEAEQLVRDVFTNTAAYAATVTLSTLVDVLGRVGREEKHCLAGPLAALQQSASVRRFARDERLMRQGADATSLMVIQEGAVEVRVEDERGTMYVIGRLGPGQLLGEMALLTSEPRTASAVAVEPVRAAVLPADSFHQLVHDDPRLSVLLTDIIAERLGNSQHDALTDKRLDRYLIRRRLGRGGMSIVYEALDTASDSFVALKMMSHRLVCSPKALLRFQREADLIQQFDHPHIVTMYRRFAAFRTYFIAMEYCVGKTLAQYLRRRGGLDDASFRHALGQIATALHHAHSQGVVHRDIKPSNIMRLNDGMLKLMDFGLAEPIADLPAGHGEVVGTPRYMSPEQRAGAVVDQRADYFSLGCVAFEMATGSPLFVGSAAEELARDFSEWQPPNWAGLSTALNEDTARTLQPLLTVKPKERRIDLPTIAAWAE